MYDQQGGIWRDEMGRASTRILRKPNQDGSNGTMQDQAPWGRRTSDSLPARHAAREGPIIGVTVIPAQYRYIASDPEILGGEPIIEGTRTPVRAIVELWEARGGS